MKSSDLKELILSVVTANVISLIFRIISTSSIRMRNRGLLIKIGILGMIFMAVIIAAGIFDILMNRRIDREFYKDTLID